MFEFNDICVQFYKIKNVGILSKVTCHCCFKGLFLKCAFVGVI